MLCRRDEEEYPLEGTTWAYPRAGFWIAHMLGILGIGCLGYMLCKNIRD